MVDSFSVDFSDLDRLAADLGEVASTAGRYVRAAVEVTARHVKDDWRKELASSTMIPRGQYSVSYDITTFQGFGASVIKAEIGPELQGGGGGVGGLVGALEYGIPGKAGPTGYGHGALQRNEPDFQHGLDEALKDAEAVLAAHSSVGGATRAVIRGAYR